MAAQDGEQEMGWKAHSARFLSEIDPQALGREAGLRAAAFLGARPVGDGRYDVILENSVAAQFLGLLAASLQGDALLKGRSLLAGKQDSQIVSPLVSLVDDGLLPRGLGSGSLDDEGVPMGRKLLWKRACSRASSSTACGGPGPAGAAQATACAAPSRPRQGWISPTSTWSRARPGPRSWKAAWSAAW